MTPEDIIARGVREHDEAIDQARLAALRVTREEFDGPGLAYQAAKELTKQAGIILSRLAQRREAVKNLALLESERTNNAPNGARKDRTV